MIPLLREKLQLLKRHYFPEVVALLVIFGAVGAFATLYAGQRASLPIPYQGKLLDSNSVPVADGTYYMAFGIYNAGGSCLWRTESTGGGIGCSGTSSSTAVTVSRGVFTVYLGSGGTNNPEITSSITNNFNSGEYWLGITACGTTNSCDSEMTPRRQIGGVPYAYNADFIDGNDSSALFLLGPTNSAQTLTFTGTTQDALTISATSTTSGTALTFTGPSEGTTGVTDAMLKITSDVGDLEGTKGLVSIVATHDSQASNATTTSLYISTTHASSSGSWGNTSYGIYNTLSDAIQYQGNIDYGIYSTVTNSGAATSTKTVYGQYLEAIGTNASAVTTTVYGLYVTGRVAQNAFGTTVQPKYYGIYVANDSAGTQKDSGGDSNSFKYGLYIAEPRGADKNYTAVFEGGAVGIGTTTPQYLLSVASSTTGDLIANIENQNTGAAARTALRIANASSTLTLYSVGSQYTTSNQNVQNSGLIESGGTLSGGMNFSIAHASAPYRFFMNSGTYQALHIKSNGGNSGPLIGIGTSTPSYMLTLDNTGSNPNNIQIGQYGFISHLQSGVEGLFIGYNLYASDRTVLSSTYPTDTSGVSGIYFGPGTTGIDFLMKNTNAGGGTFYSSSTLTNVKMRLDQYGNLGLGTTTPWTAFNATNTTSTILTIGSRASTRGILTLAGETSGLVTIQPSAAAGNWTLTLPANDGDNGQYLQTDGSGNTSWQTVSAGSGALSFVAHVSGTAISANLGVTTTLATATLPTLATEDSLLIYYTYETQSGGSGMPIQLEIADTPNKRIACITSVTGQDTCNNLGPGNYLSGNIVLRRAPGGAVLGINSSATGAGGSLSGGTVSSTWSNASWTAGTATLNLTNASSTNTTDATSTFRMTIYKILGS